jgi:flagellar protein FlgJ
MDVAAITSVSSASAANQLMGLGSSSSVGSPTLSPKALRNASPEVQRKQVAQQFEAILVRQLLGKTMTSMLGETNDAASSVFGDMLTDTFAQQLTKGGGMGLAGLLEKQLTPHSAKAQVAASAAAAPATSNLTSASAAHP